MLYNSEGKFFTIQVKIVDMEGISWRPIAHTCVRVLDIPKAYESYTVFRSEMNAVLNSSVWVMDFAWTLPQNKRIKDCKSLYYWNLIIFQIEHFKRLQIIICFIGI